MELLAPCAHAAGNATRVNRKKRIEVGLSARLQIEESSGVLLRAPGPADAVNVVITAHLTFPWREMTAESVSSHLSREIFQSTWEGRQRV
jgi:hypothetical protein